MRNEHPILFSTPMVQAILEGRKTQTRRMLKYQADARVLEYGHEWEVSELLASNPYGNAGDLLWVRETWCPFTSGIEFLADAKQYPHPVTWKPSIHMKKVDARIWLKITGVNVERLNSISEDDAIKEGVIEYEDGFFKNYFTKKGLRQQDGVECLMAKGSFQSLWCSINGLESWEQNPWVWVVCFEVISTTGKPSQL